MYEDSRLRITGYLVEGKYEKKRKQRIEFQWCIRVARAPYICFFIFMQQVSSDTQNTALLAIMGLCTTLHFGTQDSPPFYDVLYKISVVFHLQSTASSVI